MSALDEARKAAARALDEYSRRGVWGSGASKLSTDEANATIDAFLSSLAASGMVIVPRTIDIEASDAAHTAFNRVADDYAHRNLSAAFATDVYAAMIEAATERAPQPEQHQPEAGS